MQLSQMFENIFCCFDETSMFCVSVDGDQSNDQV